MPQLTAIINCAAEAAKTGTPILLMAASSSVVILPKLLQQALTQ